MENKRAMFSYYPNNIFQMPETHFLAITIFSTESDDNYHRLCLNNGIFGEAWNCGVFPPKLAEHI